MEDRFSQQLKKGVLEMLVLKLICQGRFVLKEGTLYPILYRLEDDGMIVARWSQGAGRVAPKKMYEATEAGVLENIRRQSVWQEFTETVNSFLTGGCIE